MVVSACKTKGEYWVDGTSKVYLELSAHEIGILQDSAVVARVALVARILRGPGEIVFRGGRGTAYARH